MKTYTSEDILNDPNEETIYSLQDTFSGSGIAFKYQLTEEEYNWAVFNKGKYSINDYILDNTDKNKVVTFNDPCELSEVLEADGIPHKAVMLSDDTALQKLFFYLSNND